jgi:hypothetical protein
MPLSKALEDKAKRHDEEWEDVIVPVYTSLGLSHPTDRLIAFQGIIDQYQQVTGWSNIWGLWKPFFLNELMWKVPHRDSKPRIPGFPSWSWLSVNQAVKFFGPGQRV